MDLKSTRAEIDWFSNLQESKMNKNLQYRRAQNEWHSNLLCRRWRRVCWRRRQERKRGVLVLDMRKANRFISWSIYRISRALQELLQSRHELHTSGPARRGVKSHLVVEKLCITWHVSVSPDMLAALSLSLSLTAGWPDTATPRTSTTFLMTFHSYSRLWFSISEQHKNSDGYKFTQTCFFLHLFKKVTNLLYPESFAVVQDQP